MQQETLTSLKLTNVNMGEIGSSSLSNGFRSNKCNIELLWVDDNPNIGKNGMSIVFQNIFHTNKHCKLIEFQMGNTMSSSTYNATLASPVPTIRPFVNTYVQDISTLKKTENEITNAVNKSKKMIAAGVEMKTKTSIEKEEEGGVKEEEKEAREAVDAVDAVDAAVGAVEAVANKDPNNTKTDQDNNKQSEEKNNPKDSSESIESSETLEIRSVWTILSQSLSLNKTLVILNISEELAMDDDACSDLIPGLLQNISITTLILNGNNIGNEGAALLSDVFLEQSILLHISLRRNHIGDEGGISISDSLIENNAILSLDIAHNDMDKEGEKKKRERTLKFPSFFFYY